MLPSALTDSYREYKRDTDSIAAWLASTAKANGFRGDLNASFSDGSSTKEPATGGRLKGKARVQAKKTAAAASAGETTTATGPKRIISSKEYVTLAQYIADKKLPVPHSFKITLDRVISTRTKFSANLEKHSGSELDEESNASHVHFVDVLKTVRKILPPLMPSIDKTQESCKTEQLQNRFAGLEVHEPSDKFLKAPDIERPPQVQGDSVKYEAEPSISFQDACFAVVTLINDLYILRQEVKWLWERYRDGEAELALVAITTNTAVELVGGMIEEVMPATDGYGGLWAVLNLLFCEACQDKHYSLAADLSIIESGLNYDVYDSASHYYVMVYRLLHSLGEEVCDNFYAHYDNPSGGSKIHGREKYESDKSLIRSGIVEAILTQQLKPPWPARDALLQAFDNFLCRGQVSLDIAVAVQISLDISYSLGFSIEKPWKRLLKNIALYKDQLKHFFELHPNRKPATKFKRQYQSVEEAGALVDYLNKNTFNQAWMDSRHTTGASPFTESSVPPSAWLSPLLSGLTLHMLQYTFHQAATATSSSAITIQCGVYLYNALLQQRLVTTLWMDLHVAFTILGPESFFVGGNLPSTAQDQLRKFLLQMGMSATNLASQRRRHGAALRSRIAHRGLKTQTRINNEFAQLYSDPSGGPIVSEKLKQIMELCMVEESSGKEACAMALRSGGRLMKYALPKKDQAYRDVVRPQNANSTRDMSPRELIRLLILALKAEVVEFYFPWFQFYLDCSELLSSVHRECLSISSQTGAPPLPQEKGRDVSVLRHILSQVNDAEGNVARMALLSRAATVMARFLENRRGKLTATAHLQVATGIPINLAILVGQPGK